MHPPAGDDYINFSILGNEFFIRHHDDTERAALRIGYPASRAFRQRDAAGAQGDKLVRLQNTLALP
jgi:hypothetical protein